MIKIRIDGTPVRRRISTDRRGCISSGILARSQKTGKTYPKSIDGFDVSAFAEITAAYGEQPNRLLIYLPSDNIGDVFDDEYSTWGGERGSSVKKRACDGETCTHRIDETVEGIRYGRGEVSDCICRDLPDDHKQRCRYSARLVAWVVGPDRSMLSPTCIEFRTHSINSGEAVRSELEKIRVLTTQLYGEAKLQGIGCWLSVRMVSGKEDASQKFPIWHIQAANFEPPALPEGTGERGELSERSEQGERQSEQRALASAPPQPSNDTPGEPSNVPSNEPPTRPFSPLYMQETARRVSGSDSPPAIQQEIQRAMIHLKSVCPGGNEKEKEEARHIMLLALFDKQSGNALTKRECEFIDRWTDVQREDDGAWVPSAMAIEEARRLVESVDAGVL